MKRKMFKSYKLLSLALAMCLLFAVLPSSVMAEALDNVKGLATLEASPAPPEATATPSPSGDASATPMATPVETATPTPISDAGATPIETATPSPISDAGATPTATAQTPAETATPTPAQTAPGMMMMAAARTHSVTYNINGGSGPLPIDDGDYANGATVTVQNLTGTGLSRTNYRFIGWNTRSSYNEDTEYGLGRGTFTMGSSDVTLYAAWESTTKNYNHIDIRLNGSITIDYKINGVSQPGYPKTLNITTSNASGSYKIGATSYPISNFTYATSDGGEWRKTGLNFRWPDSVTINATLTDSTDHTYAFSHTFSGSEIYAAHIECPTNEGFDFILNASQVSNLITHDVTFKTSTGGKINGGTADYECTDVPDGTSMSSLTPSTAALPGYTFAGWSPSLPSTVTADGIYTAQWSKIPSMWFNVNYNGNGNTGGTVPADTDQYMSGNTVTVKSGTPTKTGYTFGGWSDGSGHTYSAGQTFTMPSGNVTLTAVWTANTMTLTATGYTGTYDGSAHNGVTGVTASQSDAVITYSTNGTTYSSTNPQFTNAGTYTVYVKATKTNYQDATTSVTVTINKAALTITAENKSMPYGGPLPTYTYTNAGLKGTDTLSGLSLGITIGSSATVTSPVGAYDITVAGAASTANYAVSYVKGTLTITNNTSLTVSATGYTGTYDGSAHNGVTGTTPSVAGAAISYSTDGGTTYSSTNPQFVNAGSYTVKVKATLANYVDAFATVTVTINKAALTITANNKSMPYGGPLPTYDYANSTLKGTDTLSGLNLGITIGCPATVTSPVGAYDITVAGAASTTNYTVSYVKGTLTITTNTNLSVSATGYTGVYDATAHNGVLSVSPSVSGAAISYSTDGGVTYSGTNPQFTNAGTYTVKVKATLANYADAIVPVTVTISKAALTVTAENKSMPYGGPLPTYTYTNTGLKGTDTLTGLNLGITIGCTATLTSPVGTYDITVTGAASTTNYAVSYVKGTLTITNNTSLTVSATGYTGTYDALAHNGVISTTPSLAGAAISYSTDGGATYSSTNPQFVNAGTYTVKVKATLANYADAFATATVTINKAALTITANNKSMPYGGPLPTYDYANTALKGSDTLTSLNLGITAGCSATLTSPVGTYDITVTGAASSANYTVSYVKGTLTVTTNTSMTLNATGYSGTYDATAHNGVLSATPSVAGAAISYSTDGGTTYSSTNPQFTNAGTYTVKVKATLANYADAIVPVTVTIGKAALTITANNKSMPYGGPLPTYDYANTALKGTDTLSGLNLGITVGCSATVTSPVGTYDITVTGAASSANYTVSYVKGTLTITNNTSLTVSATGYTGTYDALAHNGILSATPSVAGAAISYSTDGGTTYSGTNPQFVNAGTYTVKVKATLANYADAVVPVTVTINKAALTITANDKSMPYGGPLPTYDYANTALKGTDTLSGLNLGITAGCSATLTSPVGTYDITVTGAASSANYTVSYVKGSLTISNNTSMTLDATGYTGTYDALAHNGVLNATPSVPGAAISYSTDGGTTYSSTNPQFTNAGSSLVKVKATLANYADATKTVTVTINKAALTIKANNKSMPYGGPLPTYDYSNTALMGSDTLSGQNLGITIGCSATTTSPVGTYDITVTGASGSANYDASYVKGTLTITNNTTLGLSATGYTGTYDATAHDGVTSVSPSLAGAAISYSTDNGATYSGTNPQFTNAGTYTVKVKATLANYTDATTTVTVTINKAALTVTANDKSMQYGGPLPTYDYTNTALKGTDTLSGLNLGITAGCSATTTSPVGTYDITVTGAASSANYTVSYVKGALTISNNTSMTLGASGYTGTYDATAHNGVLSATPSVSGAAISYSTDGGTTYSGTNPQFTNAGTYSVKVKATLANYADAFATATVTIGKAALTVTANDKSMQYGGPLPTYDYTNTALMGSDTLSGQNLGITIGCSATTTSPVGTYDITVTGAASSANYTVSYAKGTLTITNNTSMTLNATGYSGTYDALAHDGVLSATPSVAGAAISYSTDDGATYSGTNPQFVNAGTYSVKVKATLANYADATTTVTVTIDKAALTVTANNKSMQYGGPLPTYDYANSPLMGTETLSDLNLGISIGCAATLTSPVGPYPITVTGAAETANYTVSYVNGTLAIGKNTSMLVTATGYTGTYDAKAHEGVLNPAATVAGATLSYSTDGGATFDSAIPTYMGAGTHDVVVKATLANYADATTTVTVTIGKATLTVMADDKSMPYGGPLPAYTYGNSGLQGTDTISGLNLGIGVGCTALATSAAGTYDITVMGAQTTANYLVVYKNGKLTVTQEGNSR